MALHGHQKCGYAAGLIKNILTYKHSGHPTKENVEEIRQHSMASGRIGKRGKRKLFVIGIVKHSLVISTLLLLQAFTDLIF